MDLLRVACAPSIVQRIVPGSLKLLSGSFLDEELRGTHCDILFSAEVGERKALIYLVLEHQSTNDRFMVFRMLRYKAEIWTRWRTEHPDADVVPIILSVLVSNAPRGWTSPWRFSELHGLCAEERERYGSRLLDFDMTTLDLVGWADWEIQDAPINVVSKLVFLSMKYGRMARRFRSRTRPWLELFKQALGAPGGREETGEALRYLLRVGLESMERLVATAKAARLGRDIEEAIVTDGERLLEMGRLKGREEGRAEGREWLRAVLARQLTKRFGPLPARVEERLASSSSESLEILSERIFDLTSLDELFEGTEADSPLS